MSRRIHRLYSRKSGTPSVIFLAGMGDSGETWKIVQDRISQEASTLSYDRAGIGRSPAAAVVPRTCRDLVEELYDLLQEIEVETPCILVGHSFGGLVARLFTSLYPQLVSGLVLVDAAPEYKELAYEKVLPDNLIAANREYYERLAGRVGRGMAERGNLSNRTTSASRSQTAFNLKQTKNGYS
nr:MULTISPECIES: alpha/beta hydrolase [Bacillales]